MAETGVAPSLTVSPPAPRRRRWRGGSMPWAAGSTALILVLWTSLIVVLHPPDYVLPAPWDVVGRAWSARAMLASHGAVTIYEIVTGLALSIAVAIPLGAFIVALPVVDKLVYPILIAFNAVPKVALAPLFVVWFGYGLFPRIAITLSIAFFPVLVATVTGLKSVDPDVIQLTRSMRAREAQVFLRVRLPNALPTIFSGLKVATSLAVIGGIIGEFVASDKGWGYLLVQASGQLDTTLMFAIVVLLALFASLLFALVTVIERLTISWHASQRQR